MKQKIRCFLRQERGNIMVMFAGVLVVLIGFIGLSIDIGMLVMQRNTLQNLNQVIREDRFTYQDSIRYADNPAYESFKIIQNTLATNKFDGTVKVYFKEETPHSNSRYYRIRIVLSRDYEYTFARIFGLNTSTISVSQDGGETVGEGETDAIVWYPSMSVNDYNGSYTSVKGGSYVFTKGDIPPEWGS